MLVKKVDPTWSPAENHALQVGQVIDITDPSILLANGTVELHVEPEVEPELKEEAVLESEPPLYVSKKKGK